MKNKKNIPALRFPEFTDAWEQRKLGEIYTERNEKGNDTLQILSVSIHTGVSDGELDQESLGKFVRRSKDKSTYKHVYSGDLIFNMMRAWQGAIGVAKSEGMISPAYISAIPNKDVFPLFMDYALRRKEAIEQIDNLSYGVTDFRKRLYWDSFVDVKCFLPSVTEQKTIWKFFKQIDNLITLHQRKCEAIKKYKKCMLQKMFPQNGEVVPKLRFPGFPDDWEQRKLSDITSKIGSGKTPLGGKEAYVEEGICLIRSQNVYDDRVDLSDVVYIDEETDKSMSNSRVMAGDVLLNITGASIGRSAVYTESKNANVNQHVCIIRPVNGYEAKYIQLNIASTNGQKQIDASQAGGGREGLNFQQIGKMEFMFPNIDEQKKIGEYFSNLDNLITLHQRKCDVLKELKQGLLQQMLVSE